MEESGIGAAGGAYEGLKVVDFSQGIAGPYCAQILRQHGARVTKVEPLTGDWGRGIGYSDQGFNALAIVNNLGKRSIAIDASSPDGRTLMRRLCNGADIVIESFRPGVMTRLGLGWESLSADDPALVYVSVTAFGGSGPDAARPGSDSTLQAVSGMMRANRDSAGNPRKVGLLVVDVTTGIYTAQATGAALYHRAKSGKGTHVQASLLEAAVALQGNSIVDAALGGGQAARPYSVPAGTFATSDGYINVTSLHDRMFAGLCRAIGRPEWQADERFATAEDRHRHASVIQQVLDETFRRRASVEWQRALTAEGVVCGVVADYDALQTDPQVASLGIFQQVVHDGRGVHVPRVPGACADLPAEPAPRVGEHSREILTETGLSPAQIDELIARGIVGVADRSSGVGAA